MTEQNNNTVWDNAVEIIQRFGGIRPMATKMDVPVTTVQGWKKRNAIPENRRDDVLSAARSNDIDLSDIIEKGAANENTTGEDGGFQAAVTSAAQNEDDTTRDRHDQAVLKAERTMAAEKENDKRPKAKLADQDDIMTKIKAAERRAVQKSTIVTVVLVALVASLGLFLLWPSQTQIIDHKQRIGALETDMNAVTEKQSLFDKVVPSDLREQFGELQEKAQNVQNRVTEISEKAETIGQGVLGADAGTMSQRLSRLEEQVAAMGAPADLTGLIDKLQNMAGSAEGHQLLSSSVADLNGLVSGLQGDQIDDALQNAQQENDALGQTLEGVSPTDLKAAAMLVGLSKFRSSLRRNEPFDEDLALMQKMLGDKDPALSAAISELAPQAERGVLSTEGLSGEFKGLAGDIVVSSLKGEDVSVRERAMARLNTVLEVQKDGELITGTDTQATVARAQKMLDDGNVQGALAELQSLEGEAAQTAQPWMEQAQTSLMAQEVQELLTQEILGRIGSAGNGLKFTTRGGGIKDAVKGLQDLGDSRTVTHGEGGFVILPPQPKGPTLDIKR